MNFDQVETGRLRQAHDEYSKKIPNGLWVFDSERGEATRIPEPEGFRRFFRLISDELRRREAA